MPLSRFIFSVLFSAMLFSFLGACAMVRQATYPPGFVYLDNEQVHTSMQKMAISIDVLDRLLQDELDPGESKQNSVIAELDAIKTATDGMAGDGYLSNHRVISDNMGSFRARVREAREAVKKDVPDYHPTSRLVGECLGCHIRNVETTNVF